MRHALSLLNGEITENLQGKRFTNQAELDQELIELDGTLNKSRLGGNSLIATSLAFAQAQAAHQQLPLWQSLCTSTPAYLPIPEIQLFGGGAHAAGRIDIQDFMLIAVGAQTFGEALEWTAEVYRTAGELLRESGILAGGLMKVVGGPSFLATKKHWSGVSAPLKLQASNQVKT